jgi:PAS domain S-box-containing protein
MKYSFTSSHLHEASSFDTISNGGIEVIRTLIIEDSLSDVYVLVNVLESEGYLLDYRLVQSKEHLQSALEAETWDIIISDFMLPNLSGYEALLLTRQHDAAHKRHTPFVMISGLIGEEFAVDLIKAGADDFITKGNFERLKAAVQRELRALQERESIKESFSADAERSTQQARHESEERFRILVQNSQDIISLLDAELNILYQSPYFYHKLGYTEDKILSTSALEIIHPDDVPLAMLTLEQLLTNPTVTRTLTYRIRHDDGSYSLVESIVRNLLHDENIHALVVNSRDISERRNVEEALRQSEQQYRSLVENLAEGIVITDAADNIVVANPAAEQAFGVENGKLIGRFVHEFLSEDSRKVVAEQNLARREGQIGRYEIELTRPNGTKRWQAINSSPRFDEHGNFSGSFVIFNDVTERKNNEEANVLFSQFLERRIDERTEQIKRANAELKHEIQERKRMEEMLLQSGERLNSLLRNASDVITIVDEEGIISYESPASEKVFGFDPFERIGKSFIENVYFEAVRTVRDFLSAIVEHSDTSQTVEFKYLRGEEYVWIETTASNQLNNPAVGGIVLNSREVSMRKEAEHELKRALQQEKELNDLKSRFISMVSHEFRTPLTVMNSSAEILRAGIGRTTPEKQTLHIDRIMNAGHRIEQMLNDVLLLARGEAGKTRAVFAPLHLNEFCAEIAAELEQNAEKRRIHYTFHGASEPLPALDEKLMRSVVTNLLSNALKYSDDEVEFDVECTKDEITLTISDTGIGIPHDDQKHLFEAFHRAQNAVNIKGTGLGMSIVKYAVDAHEGTIEFSSAEDQGTTFIVVLPFRTTSSAVIIPATMTAPER